MAENKGKSGAGKFFLGALLGAAAGAIAGRFISVKKDGGEELDECSCGCDEKCECEKAESKKEVAEKSAETKKVTNKEKK